MPVIVSSQCQLLAVSKTPHAFLSHTTYQIVKEQSLFDLTLTISNPLSPVKLILLPEVIAILSPHANSRRTVLFNPSKHGHMRKGRVRLLKNVSHIGLLIHRFLSLHLKPQRIVLVRLVPLAWSGCLDPSGRQTTVRVQLLTHPTSDLLPEAPLNDYSVTHPHKEVNVHSQIIQSVVSAIHRTHVRLAHNTYSVKA